MEDFSCRDQFRELEWGKVAKGWGVGGGGKARHSFLPCMALKCL